MVLMRSEGRAWAAVWYASVLLLAGTVAALVWNWRVFARVGEADRSLKFLRAAYAWLLVSLGMLALLPAYQHGLLAWLSPDSDAARLGFSHAYYGAVRHAVTVGFISLMIVGVATRVVPTLNGVDVRALPALWWPFALLNAGCALRVGAQTATDFTAAAYPVAGVSGLLEVTSLALWGVHVWRVMIGRFPVPSASGDAPLDADTPITSRDRVGAVLDRDPALLDVFLAFGFRPLANPILRRTVAPHVSIEAAARQFGVDPADLAGALNAARKRRPGARYSLPVLEHRCC
jgi:hypothetical protein